MPRTRVELVAVAVVIVGYMVLFGIGYSAKEPSVDASSSAAVQSIPTVPTEVRGDGIVVEWTFASDASGAAYTSFVLDHGKERGYYYFPAILPFSEGQKVFIEYYVANGPSQHGGALAKRVGSWKVSKP